MSNQLRQGDVFLLRVASLPVGATKAKLKGPDIVLAYGEVTGHSHRLSADYASMYKWAGDRLIEVTQPTELLHEEHATIKLAPGIYKVVIQREYSPDETLIIVD